MLVIIQFENTMILPTFQNSEDQYKNFSSSFVWVWNIISYFQGEHNYKYLKIN
jgi:hypothetical protein